MSSSPSSVSGAAPDEFNTVPPESGPPAPVFAMTVGEWHYFKTGDGYWMRSPVTGGRAYAAICSDVLDELFAARAASREEPSDVPNEQALAFFDKLASESWLIASAWRVVRDALAASSSPSAASPEAIRCAKCGRECDPINESDAPVTHCVECAPPIPSREDARDAARGMDLRRALRRKSFIAGFLAGFDRRRIPLPGANPDEVEELAGKLADRYVASHELAQLDHVVNPAAVSHPEAQTNGN